MAKKKPYMQVALWGAVSIAMFAAIYVYEKDINTTFSKGGWFAFLPIATAFAFSFVHGNFTGKFWSVVGIEASNKIKGGK